ncbi:MAG: hypothetical protein V4659_09480 [Pseudomonadota bacterium]
MDIAARLQPVTALAGRVQSAAKLAELQVRNQMPQVTPAAYVIPSGLRGGAADAATGLFRQAIDRMISIILFVRLAGDGMGAAATAALEPLIDAVIDRIAGWAPDDATGVFRLGRGELIAFAAGMATYQLDFILDDQLRITP